MKFEVKNKWTGEVQFVAEIDATQATPFNMKLGLAVKWAIETRADLSGADLTRADLSDADLSGADLTRADLSDADLTRADLTRADLSDANLTRANLSGADLTGADLIRANLTRANLSDANLTRADLSDANLSAKNDLIAEILKLPNEIEGLRAELLAGNIDGSTYQGDCACLCGTLARKVETEQGLDIDCGDGLILKAEAYSPRERWFSMIQKGDMPEINSAAKLALEWIDEAIAIRDHIRKTA